MRTILAPIPIALCLVLACGGGQTTTPSTTGDGTGTGDGNGTGTGTDTGNGVVSNTDDTTKTGDVASPTATTEQAIAMAVWDALVANDPSRLADYVPTLQDVAEACPDMWADPDARAEIERDIGSLPRALADSFAECHQDFDVDAAEPLDTRWERQKIGECSGVEFLAEGSMKLRLPDGTGAVEIEVVKLKDGRVFLGDDPRCDAYGGDTAVEAPY